MFTSAVGNATSSSSSKKEETATGSSNKNAVEIDKFYYYQFVENIRSLMFEIEGVYLYSMKFAITKQELINQNGFSDAWIDPGNEFGPMLLPFLPVGQQFRLHEQQLKTMIEDRATMEREMAAAAGVEKFAMKAQAMDVGRRNS